MASVMEFAAMRRAITLSALGLGTTSPNPAVGCVVLSPDGRVVGEGYHVRKGEPHAEAHAVAAAGDQARGGTAVVTLEPCNHHGRTPPCRQVLLDAGVARVLIGLLDPTSRGEGGAAALRSAGVEVEIGVLESEVLLVLGPWLTSLRKGRPFVTWAYALDACGRVSRVDPTADDEWLSDVLQLRREHDAIVHIDGSVDEGLPGGHGADVFKVPAALRLDEVEPSLKALASGGVRMVLLNGDLTVANPFLTAGVIDRIVAYLEPPQAPPPALVAPVADGLHLTRIARTGRRVRAEYARLS